MGFSASGGADVPRIEGIIEEGAAVMEEDFDDTTMDAMGVPAWTTISSSVHPENREPWLAWNLCRCVVGLQYISIGLADKVFVNGTWEVVLRVE